MAVRHWLVVHHLIDNGQYGGNPNKEKSEQQSHDASPSFKSQTFYLQLHETAPKPPGFRHGGGILLSRLVSVAPG